MGNVFIADQSMNNIWIFIVALFVENSSQVETGAIFENLFRAPILHPDEDYVSTDDITPETPFSGENENDVYIENYDETEEGSHQEYYQNTEKNLKSFVNFISSQQGPGVSDVLLA